jgi:hypothetical protein
MKKRSYTEKEILVPPTPHSKKDLSNENSNHWHGLALSTWAAIVKLKWGNKCAICGETDSLQGHHLISKDIRPFRFEIDNGICLCSYHHSPRFGATVGPHSNPMVFLAWMEHYHSDKINICWQYITLMMGNEQLWQKVQEAQPTYKAEYERLLNIYKQLIKG